MPCTRPTRQRDRAQHQHYHVCSLCKKQLTTRGHLRRHLRTHTGERNYPCTFPGCETRCTRRDNLQQHLKTHSRSYIPRKAPARKGSKKLKGVLVSEWSESSSPSPSTSSFEPMVFHEHASSILELELEPVLPTPTRPQLQIHATELELVHPIPRLSQLRSPLLDDPSCNDSGGSTSQADGDARELSVDMDMYAMQTSRGSRTVFQHPESSAALALAVLKHTWIQLQYTIPPAVYPTPYHVQTSEYA
ncbi:hypothetical protein B0H14DRAFT_3861657 [Mycena olivaceomarginata]|nr:hypothetical protein B0H14DRAFT_3861657 [Mycena olivaceomarginata]